MVIKLVEMTITHADLVDYSSLSRRLGELTFKRDYLLQNGAEQKDIHISALNNFIDETKVNLVPLEMKIKSAGILTVILHRSIVDELSDEINSHTIGEMMYAAKSKQGKLYENMKQRGRLTKENYEKREELAELTLLLNSMPQSDADEIKDAIESFSVSNDWSVDISSIKIEKQKKLIQLLNRIGFSCCIKNSRLISGNQKGEKIINWNPETLRKINNKNIWVSNLLLEKFDENEDKLNDVTRSIQAMTAKRQVKSFDPEEEHRFDKLQEEYLICLEIRERLVQGQSEYYTPKIEMQKLKNEDLTKLMSQI